MSETNEKMMPSFDATLELQHQDRIPIYVEDEESKIYFETLFSSISVSHIFEVASGFLGVASRITDFEQKHPKGKVFGIRDRDYGPDDSPKWTNPGRKNFGLPVFEVENYCLDWDAISRFAAERLNLTLAASKVEAFAKSYAADITPAVAYNSLVAEYKRDIDLKLPQDVPVYPKPYSQLDEKERSLTVLNAADAERRILSSGLVGWVSGTAEEELTAAKVSGKVSSTIDRYRADLSSSDQIWKRTFPGKEILKAIRVGLLGLPADDTAIIRYVAESQEKSVPSELVILKKIITSRG